MRRRHRAALMWGLLTIFGMTGAHAWKPEVGEVPGALDRIEFIDGRPIVLSDYVGEPLIVYFGADWCGPCKLRGRPALLATFEKFRHDGLKAIYVNLDDNGTRTNKQQEAVAMGMPIAMRRLEICPPGACMSSVKELGAFGTAYVIPFAVVIDREGVVRHRLQGGRGVSGGLDDAVSDVLKQ